MIAFLLKRWRIVLQIILISAMSLAVFYYKTRYTAIASELEALKANIAYQTQIQQVKNDILRKQAEKSLNDAQLTYDENLKAIKNEYLKKQKLDNITIADLRDRLRDKIASDSFAVSNTPADTETSAEVWRDSYGAIAGKYETLKQACAITTADYNLLREWGDIACETVTCK